jgi:acyl-CoA thioesterase-1
MKADRTIAKLLSGEPTLIVALGDSLTYGWMVSKGYLDFLKEFQRAEYPDGEIRLINRGVPGDTTQGGILRIKNDVTRHRPDCVLVQYGLNDAFVGYSPEKFRSNMEAIVEEIHGHEETEIVIVTSVCLEGPKDNAFINRFYNELEALALKHGLPIARVHEYWKQKIAGGVRFESLVQYDNVHPNTEGYRYMAEAVMDVFIPSLS